MPYGFVFLFRRASQASVEAFRSSTTSLRCARKHVRKAATPRGSSNEGIDKIVKKLGEEAVETVIAAKNDSSQRIVEETADLLYHLLVTLVEKGVTLEDIREELQQAAEDRKEELSTPCNPI